MLAFVPDIIIVERLKRSPFTGKLPKEVYKESTDMVCFAWFFSEWAHGHHQSEKNGFLAL